MKKIYVIMVAIYLFSATITMFNDPNADGSGSLFENVSLTETGLTMTDENGFNVTSDAFAEVRQVNDFESGDNQFSIWDTPGLIWKAATFLGTVLFNAHFSYFMLVDYGMPAGMALMINAMIMFVEAFGYVQFIRGVGFGGMT